MVWLEVAQDGSRRDKVIVNWLTTGSGAASSMACVAVGVLRQSNHVHPEETLSESEVSHIAAWREEGRPRGSGLSSSSRGHHVALLLLKTKHELSSWEGDWSNGAAVG